MNSFQSIRFLALITSVILTTARAVNPNFCADKETGLYSDPTDCTKYYNCFRSYTYSLDCPRPLRFNAGDKTCDWPYNIPCSFNESKILTALTSQPTIEIPSTTEGILSSVLGITTAVPETAKFTSAMSEVSDRVRQITNSSSKLKSFIGAADTTPKTTNIPRAIQQKASTSQKQKVTTTDEPQQTLQLTIKTTQTDEVIRQQSSSSLENTISQSTPTPVAPSKTFCRNKADGLYADPFYCNSFYRCFSYYTYHFTCSQSLMYSITFQFCDWPENVNCSETNRTRPKFQRPAVQVNEDLESLYFLNGTTQEPVLAAPGSAEGCNRVVCYYPNWAIYRTGAGAKFGPEDVDTNLCTHIVFAFVTIKNNRLEPLDIDDEPFGENIGHFARVTNLKQKNPKLKIMLAVGGWSVGSQPFTQMAATKESRSMFVNSTIPFLRKRNFDGLDFDWEYPANRGSPPGDKEHYALLCEEFRAAFDAEALKGDRLLLTAATAAGKSIIDTAYDVPRIAKALDFINLMTYDLHGSWESVTGHHSPLKKGSWESSWQNYLNVEWVANYWVRLGAPKRKLVIGMPLYSRSYRLSTSNVQVGAPSNGAGDAGPFTKESGILAYYEVCLKFPGSEKYFIESQRVPFLVSGNQWIGYDDASSLREKVRFSKDNGFGGVMVWDLSHDDFSGQFCRQGLNPLMNAINDECSQ